MKPNILCRKLYKIKRFFFEKQVKIQEILYVEFS